jgi:tetrahydromethanopterin S-methyltransferase subunit G
MNQPTTEQFNELRKKYFELESKVERLDELEKKRDFIIRDSAVKIGISEGLAAKTHEGLNKLEREMFQLRAEIKEFDL